MLFRTRYNVLFRQFRLLTAQAGSIPAAIRLIFENCYNRIYRDYGVFDYPRSGGSRHNGMDIDGVNSFVIRMPSFNGKTISGTVTRSRIVTDHSDSTWEWGYYVTVKLSTPQTVDGTAIHYLTFAHNARNLVSDGDTVTTGTPLAIAGKTGNAEGEHIYCHLQARNVNNSGAYNPVGFSGIRNEKGEYNIKTSGSMQKIELGPVLNSQASAIWNKAKALGVTYAAFYADPDNSRQIIQLGPVSNSMASTLYSYAVNEMKVSYRSWYI